MSQQTKAIPKDPALAAAIADMGRSAKILTLHFSFLKQNALGTTVKTADRSGKSFLPTLNYYDRVYGPCIRLGIG